MTDLDNLADVPDEGFVDPIAELNRVRDEIAASKLEVDLEIPTWQGNLVGRFTPLTTPEKKELERRAKARADLTGQTKEHLQESAALDRIATGCRLLLINGNPITGDPSQGGFNATMAKFQGLEGDDVTAVAVARDVCGSPKADEFTAFWKELTDWWAKPRPKSVTDPFGVR